MLWMVLFLHLSTSANVHQFDFKVTLKAEQVALKSVMKDIEKQTGLYFMYSATGSLRVNDPVSITVTNAKLEDVLETLMESRGISWTIMDKAIVLKAVAMKPKENKESLFRTVSGSVLDKDGQPLPGATVQIKGTNIGTTAAVSGVFTIANVPMKQLIIQARYTGYETQEKVLAAEGSIVFNLKPSVSNLDETVVVAYGNATQRSVTGAVSVVKGEEIRTLPNLSFDKSLQGLVPGMRITSGSGQPGAGLSNMIVRGISTGTEAMGGSTVRNPLIVIDGMQVNQDPFLRMDASDVQTSISNPLAQINPDDIAEISVLKDAAAIALYGSKASNGVILVTTKRGQIGKPRITLSHQTDAAFLPANQPKMLNQEQYLDLLYETYHNADPTLTDQAIRSDLYTKFPYRVSGLDTSFYPAPDWIPEVMNSPAFTFSNNLSMSGGTPAQLYYLNLEYTKQDGVVKGSGYERASFRINLDNRLTDWFKLGITSLMSYNIQKAANSQTEAANNTIGVRNLSPLMPIRDEQGNYIPIYMWGDIFGGAYANPALQAQYNFNNTKIYRGLTALNADISFLRHFNFSSTIGVDYMQSENKIKRDPRILLLGTQSSIVDYDTRNANVQWTNSLKYQLQLGQHSIHLMAAQEALIQQTKILSVAVKGSGPVINPYLTDISNSEYTMDTYAGTNAVRKTLSQLVNLEYDLRKKYYASGSWRRDGASVFGNDNPFGNYWSLGGAWVLSEEPFMRSLKNAIQFMKLRGSIGIAGNAAAINSQLRYTLLGYTEYLHEPGLAGNIGLTGNPDIRWETTRQWNGGLQMDLLNNRVSITADIYSKFTKDLIYSSTLPSYTGYTVVSDNIGDIRNTGIELNISGNIIKARKFRWNIAGSWSRNTNKLLKSYNKLNTITTLIANEEGREYNSYYMPVWAGVNSENGSAQWLDENGKPTTVYAQAKKEFVGKTQPDGFGSVTNSLSWNGIELMFQLYYEYGGRLYNSAYSMLLNDGEFPYTNVPIAALDRWRKPGDIAANPVRIRDAAGRTQEYSTRFLEKSDHIRLQNIRASWQLPKRWTGNIGMETARIHIQGNNIAFWSIAKDVDPGAINPGGSVGFAYPLSRTFSIGFNASF